MLRAVWAAVGVAPYGDGVVAAAVGDCDVVLLAVPAELAEVGRVSSWTPEMAAFARGLCEQKDRLSTEENHTQLLYATLAVCAALERIAELERVLEAAQALTTWWGTRMTPTSPASDCRAQVIALDTVVREVQGLPPVTWPTVVFDPQPEGQAGERVRRLWPGRDG